MSIIDQIELRCFDCGDMWLSPVVNPRYHCPKCGSSDVLDPITTDLPAEGSYDFWGTITGDS